MVHEGTIGLIIYRRHPRCSWSLRGAHLDLSYHERPWFALRHRGWLHDWLYHGPHNILYRSHESSCDRSSWFWSRQNRKICSESVDGSKRECGFIESECGWIKTLTFRQLFRILKLPPFLVLRTVGKFENTYLVKRGRDPRA